MEILSLETELFLANRRMGRHVETNSSFLQFSEKRLKTNTVIAQWHYHQKIEANVRYISLNVIKHMCLCMYMYMYEAYSESKYRFAVKQIE